jgi:HemY protein
MIRRVLPLVTFLVLLSLVVLGTSELLTQAQKNVLLIRLPEVPALRGRNEVLRGKIKEADGEVRSKLAKGKVSAVFGQSVGTLGRLYQANQFYDHALSCYRLAREYDVQSPMWFYLSASVHQQRGETESMIGFLQHTLSLSGGYSPAVLKLADTYFKAGQMQPAKSYYKRRLELEPGDPYALMGLARIAMDHARWDLAEQHLREAILSDPRFGDAHRLMAEVHEHHRRLEEMKRSLAQAAKCTRFRPAPDPWIDELEDLCYDPDQLLVLGSIALTELDIETAVKKHFARALEIAPQNAEAHLAMGKAWFMAGQWPRAHRYLVRTIKLDPTADEAYFHLGLILRNKNNLREAEAMLLKALEYQPNNTNVLNNLGVILLEQGRFSEAVASLHGALEIYPENINARYNLGMSLWASGNSKEAVSQYRRVLEVKPKWSVAANSLAWILATDPDHNVRNGDEAVRWAKVAVEEDQGRNPEYLDTLAAAYAESGRFQEALYTAEHALSRAQQAGDKELIQDIAKRRRLYQSGRAFRN